ncbi:UDP-N-acetylglucosamine:LPS N-acetylglucosamine transferase [Desulfosporosinus sp. HMP52]|uniref:MGDG synthase family glycosyltransferase n=1 Tax=Desulfosporosinus sp. HMP52 TaxID=1487923 RepID=UPI00051FC780|nr:glycosyltransferase [Desulfosporosinus sp. HMP52]KGK89877.1 UDP-N-acetylglucosamine:LPS N-acetylglucosamine transferase [Desulfosporosinus sp. HMP52]
MKQSRILIFSAGFGNGHYRAAEAVIEEILIKEPEAIINHLDFGDFLSKRFNSMAKNLYMEMIKHTPKLWGKFYYKTSQFKPDSLAQRFLNQLGRKEFLRYIQSFAPDLIVCTYPTVSSILAQLRIEQILNIPLITIITDYTVHSHWVHLGVDGYVAACDEVKENLIAWGIKPEKIFTTGIPISPKFNLDKDKDTIIKKLGLNPKLPIFLLMGGAYEEAKGIKRICENLANSHVSVQTIIVCGKNKQLFHALEELVEHSRNPILRMAYVHNVEDLMSIASLIITKAGGLTVTEALSKNLPLLIYRALPGQEEANADFVQRLGAGNVANSEKDLHQLIEYYLKNPKEVNKMREKAAIALTGRSTEGTVNAMFKLIRSTRKKRMIS